MPGSKRSLKLIEPKPWYQHTGASEYLTHVLTEMTRLGLYDEWRYGTHELSVLSELMRWFDDQPSQQLADLHRWEYFDLPKLLAQWKDHDRAPRPRIELSVEITLRHNLSVRWYPAGYRDSVPTWEGEIEGYSGDLRRRRFVEPPDFRHYVQGRLYASYRPEHELMFIRDVGYLRPEWRGRSAAGLGNVEVLHELLICAVRSAFDHFVTGLRRSYDVTLLDDFVFEIEQVEEANRYGPPSVRPFVRGWGLEDRYDPMAARRRAERAGSGEVVQLRPKKDGDAVE